MGSKSPKNSLPFEDLVVEAAKARESAALDVYDSLTSSAGHVGIKELVAALMQMGEVATATSLKQQSNRSPTPLMLSPRRQQQKEQQVTDFLHSHGTTGLPSGGFGGFVELYNGYVEYGIRLRMARSSGDYSAHGGDRLSPRDLRGADTADARVISMATSSIAARLTDSSPPSKRPTPRAEDRSSAPHGQRSGNLSARGGLSSLGGMTVTHATDDAPLLPQGVDLDSFRKRGSPRVRTLSLVSNSVLSLVTKSVLSLGPPPRSTPLLAPATDSTLFVLLVMCTLRCSMQKVRSKSTISWTKARGRPQNKRHPPPRLRKVAIVAKTWHPHDLCCKATKSSPRVMQWSWKGHPNR